MEPGANIAELTEADYLPLNETVRAAAALVAEYEARNGLMEYTWPLDFDRANSSTNSTTGPFSKRAATATSYWYANISPKGKSPFHPKASSYVVYKNAITDCGAKGDGLADDTKAIQDCIAAQGRCGGDSLKCASTSVMPLVLYFPPGNYLISSTIEMYFQTLLIGDPTNRPRLIAAKSFGGLGVLSSDKYIKGGGGKSWYINQSNFFRQVRNFIIDIRNTPDNPKTDPETPPPGPAALHWQVAQATSLQNIDIYMREGSRGHVGIFMENGSGGLISGLTFFGGYIGLRAGNQQFTIKNLKFDKCRTAISAIWDWTFLWTNLKITGSDIGIDLINTDLKTQAKPMQTFAYLLVDSAISAKTGIRSQPFMANDGYAQLTLDNVDFAGSGTAIQQTSGAAILPGAPKIDSWIWGVVASKQSPTGRLVRGEAANPVRVKPAGLLGGPNGGYFDRPRPQYEDVPASSFRNALSNGCKGDGVADDTECLRKLFKEPGHVFLPAGAYRVTDTVNIWPGLKIVGEAWSAIVASGDKFKDMTKPHVMIKVGDKGETGDVEISDILFAAEGPVAGAVLVEWNIRASKPGSAGMWDSHFWVGGNAGSKLTAKECPRLTGIVNTNCIAVSLMMHITGPGSGYFENVWGWTADHDLEELDGTQIDIYTARGLLVESEAPTWLYATGMEHAVMYQYEIHRANNLFMGLIQTESPYFQSYPVASKPFDKSVGLFKGDPTFRSCSPSNPNSCMAWGLRVEHSSNILVYGAGMYSWFQKYAQKCLETFDCQTDLVFLSNSTNLFVYNIATVGTVEMITAPAINLNGLNFQSPRSNVSSINGWLGDVDLMREGGNEPGASITLSKEIWRFPATQEDNKGTMTVACTPPCVFVFPPATYPPLQPPPITTTWGGRQYVITPPAIPSPTIDWLPVTYNTSGLVQVTPAPRRWNITVPPWNCGAECGGNTAEFPPIPIPLPVPRDIPCHRYCDPANVTHPPVVIIPGPPPGPPPPGTDNWDGWNNTNITIFPWDRCTPETCPEDCEGDNDCVVPPPCILPICLRGRDCMGITCKQGGKCEGDDCVQGGDCYGDECEEGGACVGPQCQGGGKCVGKKCKKGGDCQGSSCGGGGGCEGNANCKDGGCQGPGCHTPGGGGSVGGGSGGSPGPCNTPNCKPPPPPPCDGCPPPPPPPGGEQGEEEEEEEEEEDELICFLDQIVDVPDKDGNTVTGKTGKAPGDGGNVGKGGVNGGGTGCLDAKGVLYANCNDVPEETEDEETGGGNGGGSGRPISCAFGAPTTTNGAQVCPTPAYCASLTTVSSCITVSNRVQTCLSSTLCVPKSTATAAPTLAISNIATCSASSSCASTSISASCPPGAKVQVRNDVQQPFDAPASVDAQPTDTPSRPATTITRASERTEALISQGED